MNIPGRSAAGHARLFSSPPDGEAHDWFTVAPLADPAEAGSDVGPVRSMIVGMRGDRQLSAVPALSSRPFDHRADRSGTETATLGVRMDGDVPQLASIVSMLEPQDADHRAIFGSNEEGFPSAATGTHVALRQNDERNGLMIGNERQLLVANTNL
jgi:hypothetical protein